MVRVACHCRRAVAIVVAVGVVDCQTSPLVTKWEIMHVTGHGVGNPKPVPRVRVFGGYGIPNLYPYPRETRDIPYAPGPVPQISDPMTSYHMLMDYDSFPQPRFYL